MRGRPFLFLLLFFPVVAFVAGELTCAGITSGAAFPLPAEG
ncbi:hypothetical protein D083_1472 [Dickeya solani RNS 08.23.3.1.A]|nr:hypothetical protein D083_1472 [Dickeya solani RNS 08.23.3.1.A]